MTLTEFLLARIAEDEAAYQLYKTEVIEDLGGWDDSLMSGIVVDHTQEMGYPYIGIDASRVLAECEAKRRIIELHPVLSWTELGRSLVRDKPMCASCADNENADYDGAPLIDWPCPTLRLLAAAYSDNPDYDKAWRP